MLLRLFQTTLAVQYGMKPIATVNEAARVASRCTALFAADAGALKNGEAQHVLDLITYMLQVHRHIIACILPCAINGTMKS